MFESSVLETPRSRWSLVVSLSLEITVLLTLIVWSILHIERLPFDPPAPPLYYFRPRHVELVAQTSVRPESLASPSALTLPQTRFVVPDASPRAVQTVGESVVISSGPMPSSDLIAGSPNATTGVPYLQGTRHADAAPAPPPAPPSTQQRPVRRGGDVMEAMLVKRILPVYPEMAKRMRVSGVVQLMGTISKEGRIEHLQVISGHPMLVKAALEAVSEWVYRPTLLNGEPVEVIAPIEVRFNLTGAN